MEAVQFVVEQAGCTSCAARIREALGEIATVQAVDIDEAADVAVVRVSSPSASEEAVNDVLGAASHGSGHLYRIRSGSWQSQ